MGTRVRILETGQEFPSVAACARALSTYDQQIHLVLDSEKAFKGFHIRTMSRQVQKEKRLYIRLRKGTDEPLAVGETEQELADLLGVTKYAVSKGILRGSRLYAVVPKEEM